PDGQFLACVDNQLGLNVLETKTGKKVWQKPKFIELSFFELIAWLGATLNEDENPQLNRFFHLQFSTDSHYLLATRSNKFRFRFKVDGMTWDETENTALGLDLTTLKPVNVGGDIKKATRRPFIFVAPDKILATMPNTVTDSGIFSFP